ncbi:MAG: hypothetical protein PSY14_16370 [bacterium]|nr:hypothetical protein [bacterium]
MKNIFKKRIFSDSFRLRQASRNNLPNWLRFLLPFVFLVVAFGIAAGLAMSAARLHQMLNPELPPLMLSDSLTIAQALILFPSLLAGISLSVTASNIFLWLIPPVRKVLDRNAQGVPGASFKEGMRTGKQAALFIALPALVLLCLGIWMPWAS